MPFPAWLLTGLVSLATGASAASTNSSWFARVWQWDDGLPNNNVVALAQTHDGYIWVATASRLARFDGIEFKEVFTTNIFSAERRVAALAPGRKGGLIVAADRGVVARLRGGMAQVFAKGLPDVGVRSCAEDSEGAIWITGVDGTTCRIREDGVRRFESSDGLPEGSVCSLAEDRGGQLWFAKGGHVGVFEGTFKRRFFVGNMKTRLAPSRAGGIWIAAGYQLHHHDQAGGVKHLGRFAEELPGEGATFVHEDRHGAVWIGTSDSGLFRFEGGRFERVSTSHPQILAFLEDAEGGVWAGTGGGGLNRIERRVIQLEDATTGLPFATVQSICEDHAGGLWAATQNGLLVRRRNGQWSTVSSEPDWPGGAVSCVAADAGGAIWIGTRNRLLHRWQDGRFTTWRNADGLEGRTVYTLLGAKSGEVWAGTDAPEVLHRIRDGVMTKLRLPGNAVRIGAMVEDATGRIWLSTSKGSLWSVFGGEVRDETAGALDPSKPIRSLHADLGGGLWIGYAGAGLGWLKDGRFRRVRGDQGLHDDHLSQIVPDDRGWFWFGSDHGIFRVRRAELEAVAEGRALRVRSVVHGSSEGLPALQANFGSSPGVLRDREGTLWLPTRSGLAQVRPQLVREAAGAPPVLLTRMAVDEQTVGAYGGDLPVSGAIDLRKPQAEIRLSPRHRRLEFEFAAPSFPAPEKLQFAYRMEGIDDEWIEAGHDRRAAYSRLPAGDYRFLVNVRNSDGVSGELPAAVSFVVTPFVWQTWWFLSGAFLAFTGGVVQLSRYLSVRRLRLRLRALEQRAALDKERARIARDLHDELGGRLTKIVLLNEVALQRSPGGEQRRECVEEISATAREVIRSLDETVWAVNPRNDTLPELVSYAGQFAVEFTRAANIRCHLEVPDELPPHAVAADVRHHLFLAIKEALNNLVRHSGATEAWLRVAISASRLQVSIEDNGRGCREAPENATADGLRNMRRRMEEIGGRFTLEPREHGGTRVILVYHWPMNAVPPEP